MFTAQTQTPKRQMRSPCISPYLHIQDHWIARNGHKTLLAVMSTNDITNGKNSVKNTIGTALSFDSDISEMRCLQGTKRQHPPSRYICCCTTRLQSSFFPQAVTLLNSSSLHL